MEVEIGRKRDTLTCKTHGDTDRLYRRQKHRSVPRVLRNLSTPGLTFFLQRFKRWDNSG